jgi:hypothetical protein
MLLCGHETGTVRNGPLVESSFETRGLGRVKMESWGKSPNSLMPGLPLGEQAVTPSRDRILL